MDVPTRQSYVAAVVLPNERTFANGLTNLARNVFWALGSTVAGLVMLVSVTERTREIGVRMAVGATEDDVRLQFLIEALVLGLIGGTIGIVFGVTSSLAVSQGLGWPIRIPLYAIAVSTIFAIAIALFFGFYPARRASQLNPIEALRYE